ncbi:tetratricopeptide repeat protein [Pontibacter sp. G13]|uniref:tetratricopeptide repeat protein n=1 Tax=Pontibacter sp. G13 TaxID=3074898 RepID=UPI0028897339|nr:tetratricopeptide repeat protein [Pontibacter sp. G13]WNJ19099.1 hypothetical protein RJD25_01295 [Pontibacter sp. G13]
METTIWDIGLGIILLFIGHSGMTILHELGHAIPILLFTKGQVSLYLGTYGEEEDLASMKFGRIQVIMPPRFQYFSQGLCVPEGIGDLPLTLEMIHVLAGPIFPFLISILLALVSFSYESDPFLKWFSILIVFHAARTMIQNLTPHRAPVLLSEGRFVFNDGEQIRRLISRMHLPEKFEQAFNLHQANQFDESNELLKELIEENVEDPLLLQIVFYNYLHLGDGSKILDAFEALQKSCTPQLNDLAMAGYWYSMQGMHPQAKELYDEVLGWYPNHEQSLINRACTYNEMQEWTLAFEDLSTLADLTPGSSYVYSTRAATWRGTGKLNQAAEDADKSIVLDPKNPYGHLERGILYQLEGRLDDALQAYRRAYDIDPATYSLQSRIKELQLDTPL